MATIEIQVDLFRSTVEAHQGVSKKEVLELLGTSMYRLNILTAKPELKDWLFVQTSSTYIRYYTKDYARVNKIPESAGCIEPVGTDRARNYCPEEVAYLDHCKFIDSLWRVPENSSYVRN